MDIYIEYIIIDNMVFDSLLLFMVVLTLRIKLKKLDLALAAAIGTGLTMVIALVNINIVLLNLIKIGTACTMVFVGVRVKNFKTYLMALLLFFAYTFALGGSIIGLFYIFNIDFENANTLNYISNIPIGLYVLGIFLIGLTIYNIINYINQKRAIKPFSTKVIVEIGETTYTLDGYFDSGNSLSYNGVPVCVVGNKKLHKHIIDTYTKNILEKNDDVALIKYSTIAGKNTNMVVLKAKKILINNDEFEAYLGTTSLNNIKLNCEILLNIKLMR